LAGHYILDEVDKSEAVHEWELSENILAIRTYDIKCTQERHRNKP